MQPRFRVCKNSLLSYPKPYGAWKWMLCFRPYHWQYAPKRFWVTHHYNTEDFQNRTWVMGFSFCCISIHYQPRWRDC
jgi:hypothetical protein